MMFVYQTHTSIRPMQLFPATYDRPKTRNAFRHTAHAQRHRTVAMAQYLERHVEVRSPAPELNFAPDGLVGFTACARSDGESDQTPSACFVQVPGPQ